MNKFLSLFTAALFVSLTIFVGCGSSSDPAPAADPLADQAALITAGASNFSSVSLDGTASQLDWSQFSLTFTGTKDGGSYTATGIPAEANPTVWKDSGSWTFQGTDANTMVRDDGIVMAVSVSATTMQLTFDITNATSRTQGLNGNYVFSMRF